MVAIELLGAWQARLLRTRAHAPWRWVVASALGWSLAGGLAAVADGLVRDQSARGVAGAAAYLGILAVGGLVLGVVTGVALGSMLRRAAAT